MVDPSPQRPNDVLNTFATQISTPGNSLRLSPQFQLQPLSDCIEMLAYHFVKFCNSDNDHTNMSAKSAMLCLFTNFTATWGVAHKRWAGCHTGRHMMSLMAELVANPQEFGSCSAHHPGVIEMIPAPFFILQALRLHRAWVLQMARTVET